VTVAVLRFPGSNCEHETLQALNQFNIPSKLVEWNSAPDFNQFSGVIIPGGFSYQDRIRAGVISAKLDIIKQLKQHSEKSNIPILGICNGAQILVESGLLSLQNTSLSLDAFIDNNYTSNQLTGFISDWAFLSTLNPEKSIFLRQFNKNDVIPIQICHGEGKFITATNPTSGLQYCTIDGTVDPQFPTTPNGSQDALAGISNATGNVLAIMPHPERSLTPSRYPFSIQTWAKKHNVNLVDWSQLFLAFKEN
jgi:phosphoribosylformylglycinamidine synthase subunit PurQ / glutaminase